MKTGMIMAVVIVAMVLTAGVIVYSLTNYQSSMSDNGAGGTMLAGSGDYDNDLIGGDADPGTGYCTQDAMICPDGSAVGRVGPNCEFAACPADDGESFTVEITSSGFSPKTLEIEQGDTVTWVNKGSSSAWPASDNHPTHNIYQGFDAKKGLMTGETYSFTFDKVGTWGYHDHLSSSDKGTIIVK